MSKKIVLSFLYLAICLLFSCGEEEQSWYFTVDGQKSQIKRVVLYPSADTEQYQGQSLYESEIVFGGKEDYHYLEIRLLSTTQIIQDGTYHFDFYVANLSQMEIRTCRVSYGLGNSLSVYSSYLPDPGDEVTLIVNGGSGNNFTLDLSAVIDGHEVTAYYKGNVDIFEPN